MPGLHTISAHPTGTTSIDESICCPLLPLPLPSPTILYLALSNPTTSLRFCGGTATLGQGQNC